MAEAAFKKRRRARRKKRNSRHVVRKVLACLLFFAALCVLPVYINMAIGYLPVLTYVVILALCFAYPRILARKLEFGLLMDRETCLRDADVNLLVRFSNPVRLVCPRIDAELFITDIFGKEDTSNSFAFALGAKALLDFNLSIRFAHIGTVSAGLKQLVVYDPLGLFFCKIAVDDVHEIEVLPHIYPVDASLSSVLRLQDSMEAATPFNQDGMDYTGVREYVYGDPLKSIHWKLTSHADELYTRLFDSVGEPTINILCDTAFGEHDSQVLMSLYDAELETALSVYEFSVENKLRAKVSFCDADGAPQLFDSAQRPAHKDIVHDFPSALESGRPGDFADLVLRFSKGVADDNNLVVCTADLSEELVSALETAARGMRSVIVFFVLPAGIDSVERRDLLRPARRLEQSGICCFALESASELEEITYA